MTPILSGELRIRVPPAAFYLWVETPIGDEDFARELFASQHVTVLPGRYLSRPTPTGDPGAGRVASAALDAFETEPPSADNPLLALENVIGTPHTGAHSDSATNSMGWGSLNDCLAVLRGEKPKFPVT